VQVSSRRGGPKGVHHEDGNREEGGGRGRLALAYTGRIARGEGGRKSRIRSIGMETEGPIPGAAADVERDLAAANSAFSRSGDKLLGTGGGPDLDGIDWPEEGGEGRVVFLRERVRNKNWKLNWNKGWPSGKSREKGTRDEDESEERDH